MPLDLETIKASIGDGMQGLQQGFTNLTQGTGAQDLKSRLSDIASSDELKAVLPYLLSGGAAATIGGMTTGRQREEKGEGRAGYMARVLRNALAAGGLAAGGHYLLNKGLDSTVGSVADAKLKGGAQQGPLETMTRNIAFSPLTAAGVGAGALYATHDMKHIGSGDTKSFLDRLDIDGPKNLNAHNLSSTGTASQIGNLERGLQIKSPRDRRLAGLPSDVMSAKHDFLKKIPDSWLSKIPNFPDGGVGLKNHQELKGMLSTMLRRGPMSTFGQTHMRRTGRGALGLAAAGVPALLGAFLTSDPDA